MHLSDCVHAEVHKFEVSVYMWKWSWVIFRKISFHNNTLTNLCILATTWQGMGVEYRHTLVTLLNVSRFKFCVVYYSSPLPLRLAGLNMHLSPHVHFPYVNEC